MDNLFYSTFRVQYIMYSFFLQKIYSFLYDSFLYLNGDLRCNSPERLTLDAELTDEAIDKGVIMEKSEASEDLAARCESILAVGRTHASEDRPKSLVLSAAARRCLACMPDLLLLPRPKCRSSKCLLRFLD